MPRKPSNAPRPHKDIGDRLRLIMEVEKLSGVQVQKLLGIKPTRWSNYVCGITKIPEQLARELQIYGVSLEWIYSGQKRHLTHEFVIGLAKAEAERQNAG
jgi:transcriptional regulator with XRE-family HTH domain